MKKLIGILLLLLNYSVNGQSTIVIPPGTASPGTRTVSAEIINSQENISGSENVDYVFMEDIHLTDQFKVHGLTNGKVHLSHLASSNSVLTFNGTSQSVNLGSGFINGARTIEFWFKPGIDINGSTNFITYSLFTRASWNIPNEIGIYIKGTDWPTDRGYLVFAVWDGGTLHEIKSNSNIWSSNNWYHICGTIDPSGGMKLYVNGVLQTAADPSVTSALVSGSNNVMLGVFGDLGIRYYNGKFDELRIWDRAMSNQEIKDNMCKCMNLNNASGLQAYWKFDEGSGTSATDATPNANVASVNAGWIPGNVTTDAGSSCDQLNEFKIGVWSYFWDWGANSATDNGLNTSQLNVLKDDGVNIVSAYGTEDINGISSMLQVAKSNNMMVMPIFAQYFSINYPTYGSSTVQIPQGVLQDFFNSSSYWSSNITLTGTNIYSGQNCSNGKLIPNFDDILDNIIVPSYTNIVWGLQTNEEAASCHERATNGFPCSSWNLGYECANFDGEQFDAEVPKSNVIAARQHFEGKLAGHNMNAKLISMEAGHGHLLTNEQQDDPNQHPYKYGKHTIQPIDFVDILSPTNPRDVFFEGSYYGPGIVDPNNTDESFNIWDKSNLIDQDGAHYLNKFQNINKADDYANEVHNVMGISSSAVADGFVHSRGSDLPNADYLWFQTYTSIIHGVKGVWLYGLRDAYNSDPTDQQHFSDLSNNSGNHSFYDLDHFPSNYKNYYRYLIREIAYLKNNGFLNIDGSSEVYSRTSETDDIAKVISGFSPLTASDHYLPAQCSGSGYCCDITHIHDFVCPGKGDLGISYFFNHNYTDERFKPRYTIRTNGNDAILIVSNPFAFGTQISFDFSCINNEIIKSSIGVEQLFSNEEWNANGSNNTTYKVNRDGMVDLQGNSVGIKKYIAFTGMGMTVNMGPLDVMVFKFRKSSTPFTGTHNGFTRFWSNHGNNTIGEWTMRPDDRYYSGDFNGDGKKNELLCAQGTGTWMTLLSFDNNNWNTLWSNHGVADGFSPYRWGLIVGDFDGDGKDDVLGNDGSSTGWTTLFVFANNSWQWKWSDGGNAHPIRPYRSKMVVGNYDTDSRDEILGYQPPGGSVGVLKYFPNIGTQGDFIQLWRKGPNDPNGTTIMYGKYYIEQRAGDFDNDGIDEIVSLEDQTEFVEFNFASGDFNSGTGDFVEYLDRYTQPCGPIHTLNGWALPEDPGDIIFTGNIDEVDTNDELVQMSKWGYMQTNSLDPANMYNQNCQNGCCPTMWISHDWAMDYNPYLDDYYIPGGNEAPSWKFNNFGSSFSCNQKSNDGILMIRKTCIGLCNIYYANNSTVNYRTGSTGSTSNNTQTEGDKDLANNNPDIEVYPNPADNLITISLESSNAMIEIYDYVGNLVLRTVTTSEKTKVDVSGFKEGIYMIISQKDGKTLKKSFIIQK